MSNPALVARVIRVSQKYDERHLVSLDTACAKFSTMAVRALQF